jgi:hypothetical protein
LIALAKVLGPPSGAFIEALAVKAPESEITWALVSGAQARKEIERIEVRRKLQLNFNHSIRIEK